MPLRQLFRSKDSNQDSEQVETLNVLILRFTALYVFVVAFFRSQTIYRSSNNILIVVL